MSEQQLLVVLPPKETALAVFSAEGGLEPYLKTVRYEIDAFVPDVSTASGRKEIASMANKVARSKTALDEVGKELVADLKELPKKIDAERKRMRDVLDAWKIEVRQPLTEFEEAEATRVHGHKTRIERMDALFTDAIAGHKPDEVGGVIDGITKIIDKLKVSSFSDMEEFKDAAEVSRDRAIARGLMAVDALRKEAELEKLRQEAVERERIEREARIAEEAAELARQQEREAAARREAEANAAAERAKREAIEAQQRADNAAEIERKRIADEQAEIERQAAAREADVAHRKAVNNKALAALVAGGVPDDIAKTVITLIVQGKVPGVRVTY